MFTRHPSATQKGISMHSDSNADQLAFEVDGVPTPNGTSVPSASTVTEPSTPPSSSASALDTLLNEYRARATSEREKGTLFEELTRQFLLHDARFAHQFKEVYLWGEWPEHRTGDTGIDWARTPKTRSKASQSPSRVSPWRICTIQTSTGARIHWARCRHPRPASAKFLEITRYAHVPQSWRGSPNTTVEPWSWLVAPARPSRRFLNTMRQSW